MLTSSVPAGILKTRVPGLCAFTFETRAEYDAQEENNSSRFPRGALGAATGGENSKHPPNTPVTVPKPKFEDAKLELGLRERRTGIFQKLKRLSPRMCCQPCPPGPVLPEQSQAAESSLSGHPFQPAHSLKTRESATYQTRSDPGSVGQDCVSNRQTQSAFSDRLLAQEHPAATHEAGDHQTTSVEQLPIPGRAVLSTVPAPISSKPVFLKDIFTCRRAFQITFKEYSIFSTRGLSWLQTSETSLR
ncbi:uncharacterized protein LOC118452642 [Egretta garzetta]|uniref:uncharacterized protein LOC118452642 n=1 Tax=Egretta garzetta TaxID=188379 RepID=UPI00163CFA7D|nr:uncharacterized protein LOC118452642 [Egretta garzetta]